MRHPAQGAIGGWGYWVLYSSGFLCVSSHYLILPRVSSLVIWGLGVSAPTPKPQGLISGQEWRFHKWFVMTLTLTLKSLSCVRLCDPMDCSLPGSSVHGIFQARVLEWVAISFSRRSSQPRDQTQVSCIVGRCFTVWATREVPTNIQNEKPKISPT